MSKMEMLFPISDYWWFYLGFLALVGVILVLDLGVFHRDSHAVTAKEAGIWSLVWVSLALVFNYGFYRYALWKFSNDPSYLSRPDFDPSAVAGQVGLEFLAGYLIEKALAVDNIFVFIVVFGFFKIPAKYQHRILFYGILGALIFRAIFIALGSVLMQYQWVVIGFGVFLIFTGIKLVWSKEESGDPADNKLLQWLTKLFPVSKNLDGQKFFTIENGKRVATPLFLTLIFIELTDIVFAVDSVPAIFAVTKEPLIVFTSNIFAILGLRSLYFLLANVVDRFHLLKYGLAAVLVFVGLKMAYLNAAFDGHFPISWSLGIISFFLFSSVAASWLIPPKKDA